MGKGIHHMAVTATAAPERWLQGLDRLVASVVEVLPSIPVRTERVSARWVLERGPVRASAPVDALGGFPGALRVAHRLPKVSLIVTDRYLVIGEGHPAGFALPMEQIAAAGLVRPSSQANTGLVVHFQDGPDIGTFAVNFRGLPRGLSGRLRADEVLAEMLAAGIRRAETVRGCTAPRLARSWDEASRHAGETLVWSGMATAAVGGWYGMEQRACRVWLTDASLFWASLDGTGVNRLPLDDIHEIRDGAGDRVRIATRDTRGSRFDLPFDFAYREPGVSASDQRHRFLNILAGRGIAIASETPVLAPWRRGGMVRPTDRDRARSGYFSPESESAMAVPMRPMRRSAS